VCSILAGLDVDQDSKTNMALWVGEGGQRNIIILLIVCVLLFSQICRRASTR
jgi:hypothetical protein